jgi:8-oxo-dGTP diphosphatase
MEKYIKGWIRFLKEEKARKFTARVIIINNDGKILLLQNKEDNKWYPNEWVFPGGGSEPGESPEDCAVRELYEETGLKVLKDSLYHIDTLFKKEKKIYIFVCSVFEGTVNMKDVAFEHQNYDWVDPADLDNYPMMKHAEALIRKAFGTSDVWGSQQFL